MIDRIIRRECSLSEYSRHPHGLTVTMQTGLITSLVAMLDLIFFLYDVSFRIPLSKLF